MFLRKLVPSFSNQDWNNAYSKWHCHHKYYMEYSTCKYKITLYESKNICLHCVIKITVVRLQNIMKIIRISVLSKIQKRNKMADKIHENKLYIVANAYLFDSSEQSEVLLMICYIIVHEINQLDNFWPDPTKISKTSNVMAFISQCSWPRKDFSSWDEMPPYPCQVSHWSSRWGPSWPPLWSDVVVDLCGGQWPPVAGSRWMAPSVPPPERASWTLGGQETTASGTLCQWPCSAGWWWWRWLKETPTHLVTLFRQSRQILHVSHYTCVLIVMCWQPIHGVKTLKQLLSRN